MPKKKKGLKKRVKSESNIHSNENFDEDLRVVYIEYGLDCPKFKKKAKEFKQQLISAFPDMKLQIFENRPRDGAFEIKVARNCRLPVKEIWSGVDKEPRDEKFPPDTSDLINSIKSVLQ